MNPSRLFDFLRGQALTIPPMDGVFRPDNRLEQAPARVKLPRPDNLAADAAGAVFSSDERLYRLPAAPGGEPLLLYRFPHPIISLAARPGGGLAAGLDDHSLWLFADGAAAPLALGEPAIRCPTALLFLDERRLAVCVGSSSLKAGDWRRDLLSHHRQGSVWLVDIRSREARCLARGLAFPNGVAPGPQPATLAISESWRHRLLQIPLAGGAPIVLADQLPAYPGRIVQAAGGGYWLACFAPRNRLVEFVLREKAYRRDMLAEVPPDYWIAPALSSGGHFLEPLQCGGVKTMGVHKPWSPSRSWGLAVYLDSRLRPAASYHSRADGTRHGVTSILPQGKHVWVAAKGGDVIVDIGREATHG